MLSTINRFEVNTLCGRWELQTYRARHPIVLTNRSRWERHQAVDHLGIGVSQAVHSAGRLVDVMLRRLVGVVEGPEVVIRPALEDGLMEET